MTQESFAGVRVTGQGTTAMTPDLAVAVVAAEARGTTTDEASARADEAARAMVAAAREAGVADADRQTRGMSLGSWRERAGRPPTYEARRELQLRLRDLDAAGSVLGRVLAAGGDLGMLDSFRLGLDDREAALSIARSRAMIDARRRAAELANSAARTLGPVVAVVEEAGRGGDVPFGAPSMLMAGSAPPGPPVESGVLDVDVRLIVDFAWSD